jgi:hypothetical protein
MRTPKAGETWVWEKCEKHRYRQLRDVVLIGLDFEDQPPTFQEMILEHIRCGCQHPADDLPAAIRDLRRFEAIEEMEFKVKIQKMIYPEMPEIPFPWFVVLWLFTIAVAVFLQMSFR